MQITLTVDSTDKAQVSRLCAFMLESVGFTNPLRDTKVPQEHALPLYPPVPQVEAANPLAPMAHISQAPLVSDPVTEVGPTAGQAFAATAGFGAEPGIQTDSKGFPWDGRIHASSRNTVADGTWRKKRQLDDALVAQVEAELVHMMGLPAAVPPAPAVIVPPPPAAKVPTPPPFVASVEALAVPTATGLPPPPLPVLPLAGAASIASLSSPLSFPTLMKAIVGAFTAKTLTQDDIARACARLSIPSLPALVQRPDLVGTMATELGLAL